MKWLKEVMLTINMPLVYALFKELYSICSDRLEQETVAKWERIETMERLSAWENFETFSTPYSELNV